MPQKKASLQLNATSSSSSGVESGQASSPAHSLNPAPTPQAPTPKPTSGMMSALPAAAAPNVPSTTRLQPTPVPPHASPEATRSSTPASNSSPVRPDAPQGPLHPGIQPSGQFPQSSALRMPPNGLPQQVQAAANNVQRPPSQQQIGRAVPPAAGAQHTIPPHTVPQQQPQRIQPQQSQPQSQGAHSQSIQQQQQPVQPIQPRIAQMRQQPYSQVNQAQSTNNGNQPQSHSNLSQMAQLQAQAQTQAQSQQQGRPTGTRTPLPPQASPPPQQPPQQQPQQQTQPQQGQHQFHSNTQRYPTINGAIPVPVPMGMMMGSQQPNGLPIQMQFNPQMAAAAAAAVMGNPHLNRGVAQNPQNAGQVHPSATPGVGVPQRPNSQIGAPGPPQRGPSSNIQHSQPQQQMHLGNAPRTASIFLQSANNRYRCNSFSSDDCWQTRETREREMLRRCRCPISSKARLARNLHL